MTRWGKVDEGDVVELKGKRYVVTRLKRKGDAVKVAVRPERGGAEHTAKVPARQKVTLAPLHDESGAQRRWAKPADLHATGRRWDKPQKDDAGRAVEQILGGVLVAEKPEGADRYAVPPQDITTVRAHLLLFHELAGDAQPAADADALALHERLHAEHPAVDLPVPHEHLERRPGDAPER